MLLPIGGVRLKILLMRNQILVFAVGQSFVSLAHPLHSLLSPAKSVVRVLLTAGCSRHCLPIMLSPSTFSVCFPMIMRFLLHNTLKVKMVGISGIRLLLYSPEGEEKSLNNFHSNIFISHFYFKFWLLSSDNTLAQFQ